MVILAMTTLLAYLVPAIRLKAGNQFLDLRWHRARIVPCHGGFKRRLFVLRASLCLPELALAPWAKVLGPFAGDGDLIYSLV
jgi:hypothetical protein